LDYIYFRQFTWKKYLHATWIVWNICSLDPDMFGALCLPRGSFFTTYQIFFSSFGLFWVLTMGIVTLKNLLINERKIIKTLSMHNKATTTRYNGVGSMYESHSIVPCYCGLIVHNKCKDHSPFFYFSVKSQSYLFILMNNFLHFSLKKFKIQNSFILHITTIKYSFVLSTFKALHSNSSALENK
jgi:hypothetical protein